MRRDGEMSSVCHAHTSRAVQKNELHPLEKVRENPQRNDPRSEKESISNESVKSLPVCMTVNGLSHQTSTKSETEPMLPCIDTCRGP
jgi:hypothetical protein